ncbi:hypothetical protein BJ085DRAFT_27681 [Dimargaris cristalligena]|uniref:Uncharacterized protein n=1 Tax=Dimargaris cristalligena TaxID=215637 RepID=A0A4P9ZM16_9FUNG|nr:hypothetical protein BJ085DRAFT_27681 [Dimargaris cristalligena]|eukprot:RKP34158.1 hypothetical protein BJ085DRAFT_27681 [Dimargaris cristalligena]
MAEPSSPSSKSRAWSPSSPSSTSRHPPVPASSLRPPSLFDFPAASPLSSTTMFTPSPTHNAATLPRSNRDHIAANGTGDPAERVRLQHLADQPGKHHRQSRSFSHSNHKLSDLMVPPQSPLGAQAEEAKSGHARIGSKASPTGRLRSITAVNSSPVELAKISTTLATSITTLRDESISPKSADGPMAERSLSSDALSATATLSVPEFIVPRTAALAAAAPGGSASTLGRSRTWKLSNSLKNASAQPGGINALGKGPAGVSADVMALKTTPMDGTMSLGRSNRLAHATASQNGDSSSPNALQPYSSSVLSASTANFATEPLSAMTTGLGGKSVSANTSPTDAAVSGEKWVLVRNFTKYDSRKTSATAAAAATAVVAAAVEAGTPPPASVGDLLDIEAVHHHRHHHPPRGPIDTSVASGQPPIHQTRSNPVVLPTMTKPATAGTSEIFAPLDDMTGDELTSPISASLEIPPRISSASLGNGGGSSSTTKDNSGGGLPPSIHQLIQPTRKSSNQSGMISTVSSSSPFPSPSPSPLASTTSTSAAVAAAATTTHHHATGGNGSSGGGLSIQFLEDALARLPKLSREGSRGGDISQRLSTPSLEGLIQRVQNIAGGSNQHLHYIGNTGTAIGPSGFAANSQVQALDSMELADVITQSRKRLQYYRRLWQEVTEPDSDLTRWLQAQPTTTMPVTMATTTTFGKRSATPPTIINTGLRKLPLVKSSSSTPTTPLTTPPALDRSASASSSGGHTHGNGSSLFLSPKSRELIDQILNQGGGQVDSTGSKMPTGSASGPAAKPLTLSLSSSSSSSLSPSPSETPSPRPSGPGPATHPMVNYAASLSPPNLSSTGNIHEGSRNRSGSGNGNGGLPLSTSSRSATSLSSLTNGNLLHLPAANHGGAGDPRFRSYESISHSEVDSVDTNNFGGYFGSDPNLPLGTISNPLATEFGGKRGGSASAGSGNSAAITAALAVAVVAVIRGLEEGEG